MTTKAKTREAPMSGAVIRAVARHKAAQAAIAAAAADPNGVPQHLWQRLKEEEFAAIDELAMAPCASEAELKDKLCYLRSNSRNARLHGDHVTLRLRYRILRLRALIWVLRWLRAG